MKNCAVTGYDSNKWCKFAFPYFLFCNCCSEHFFLEIPTELQMLLSRKFLDLKRKALYQSWFDFRIMKKKPGKTISELSVSSSNFKKLRYRCLEVMVFIGCQPFMEPRSLALKKTTSWLDLTASWRRVVTGVLA